ncbi:MAG: succinate--CoA ligase subunit alpha [Candidatus Woesearchaeota archaeon]
MVSLISPTTKVVVQGMTGKEGARASEEMIASGINVVCGVTPGKKGTVVCEKPIYNTIAEAQKKHNHSLNTSVLYVPPLMVYDACMEAIHNNIKTIIIVTENVPVYDTAKIIAYAREKGCIIVGPSSIGILDTSLGKLGSIGTLQQSMYSKGNLAIISKSGGMCAETAGVLTKEGIGQSIIVGIGGDQLMGTSFADLMPMLEEDSNTHAIVIYGEIGGVYEEELAQYLTMRGKGKPVIAYISGQFAEHIPRSVSLGHAGAIIENGKGTANEKKEILKKAGAYVADYHYEIPELVKKALKEQIK